MPIVQRTLSAAHREVGGQRGAVAARERSANALHIFDGMGTGGLGCQGRPRAASLGFGCQALASSAWATNGDLCGFGGSLGEQLALFAVHPPRDCPPNLFLGRVLMGRAIDATRPREALSRCERAWGAARPSRASPFRSRTHVKAPWRPRAPRRLRCGVE